MKVLHFVWSRTFGGIERLVVDLVREQQRLGYGEQGLLFGKGGGELVEDFSSLDVQQKVADLTSGLDFRAEKGAQVADYMSAFDIVHFHTFNPLIARAAIRAGSRIVYTEHGNFGFGRKRTLQDVVRDRLLRRFLNRHVDAVTFNSAFTRATAEARYGLEGVERHLVYNGVPQSRTRGGVIDEATKAALAGRFVVGTSSRLAGFKRVDRLIEAFARFQPGRNTVLLIVGDGIERAKLEAQVDQLGLQERVLFVGYRREVQAYQAAMDVCVFPSENEPFGLVAVETMNLGKPTLVFSDGGGLCEIVAGLDLDDVVPSTDVLAA